jgi:hypothetical protein
MSDRGCSVLLHPGGLTTMAQRILDARQGQGVR